jgi:hypothetical protein
MNKNLIIALLGIALALVYSCAQPAPLVVEPEPVVTHTVKFTIGTNTNGQKFILVTPEVTGGAEQGHVVVFVNQTGQVLTVDFSASELGTPFFGAPTFEIGSGTNSADNIETPTIYVNPEKTTEYKYTVENSPTEDEERIIGLDQSPRIRIGPKSVIENP